LNPSGGLHIHGALALLALLLISACAVQERRDATTGRGQWDLATGSSIAHLHIPTAQSAAHLSPIVVLHGGPGAYAVELRESTQVLSRLSGSGRDVYFYDQVGGGLSERLADVTEYTVNRHIADLEAIRGEIGAERMVLLGSSWGATLAAHYAARYPNRVAGLVLSGPGVIHPGDWPDGYGRVEERMTQREQERFQKELEWPRLTEAIEASMVDPNRAAAILPDQEAGAFFDRIATNFYMPHMGCKESSLRPVVHGYGFWANRMTSRDFDASSDPKPALASLTTPTLVLRGECEYMHPAVAEQYHAVFRNSELINVAGAGHMVYWEQPQVFLEAVRSFLRGVP
jgi:pimeloyl-ACP methyl ester carboxylesterase